MQAQGVDTAQLEKRFVSVGTLLTTSSAAKQIEATGDPESLKRHADAKLLYDQAKTAFAAGDLNSASRLLSEASVTMFSAVRTAAPERISNQKAKTDFDNKLESVKALLAAQKRISEEKGNVANAADSARQIEQLLADAQAKADAKQLTEARATLERAYLMAKASISSMRTGDTLVRSLNFASKEEEYHYELDRNDTHQMLIKVLVEEKAQANPSMDERMKAFLERAGQLRGQAESSASRGDYGGAIQLLETSTAELVKAIRNAGIYIPG
ncbi:MAG: hypothetical protein KDG55_01430 [Rhodocyclaceae bacterium]|nr:hypothetical protein [Rhodocyclaceae bacterium]